MRRVIVTSSPLRQPMESAEQLGYEVQVLAQIPTTLYCTPRGSTRVRYREQGVDELLQLKLYQAIVDVRPVPPNATIVLATGDGNAGEFNEEGFLGCVRIALRDGWRVELYAWEEGLSRSWGREFSEGPYRHRFSIHDLSEFGEDLLEV